MSCIGQLDLGEVVADQTGALDDPLTSSAARAGRDNIRISAGQRGVAQIRKAPPAGFEPAHTAPEAVALSPELWGLAHECPP